MSEFVEDFLDIASSIKYLQRTQEIAQDCVKAGRHPFGALLLAPDNCTILLEQGNVDSLNHAEATLLRTAYAQFSPDYLWGCTLFSSVEPCCMCAACLYWANVGKLVFAIDERDLLGATGAHHENPTLDLPCRNVFACGQKKIKVQGPLPQLREQFLHLHLDFWRSR